MPTLANRSCPPSPRAPININCEQRSRRQEPQQRQQQLQQQQQQRILSSYNKRLEDEFSDYDFMENQARHCQRNNNSYFDNQPSYGPPYQRNSSQRSFQEHSQLGRPFLAQDLTANQRRFMANQTDASSTAGRQSEGRFFDVRDLPRLTSRQQQRFNNDNTECEGNFTQSYEDHMYADLEPRAKSTPIHSPDRSLRVRDNRQFSQSTDSRANYTSSTPIMPRRRMNSLPEEYEYMYAEPSCQQPRLQVSDADCRCNSADALRQPNSQSSRSRSNSNFNEIPQPSLASFKPRVHSTHIYETIGNDSKTNDEFSNYCEESPRSSKYSPRARSRGQVQFNCAENEMYSAEKSQSTIEEQDKCKLRNLQIENLVKDKYCPGVIQETIDGKENFNDIAFGLTFDESGDIPEQRPEIEPLTLLEAFQERIELERCDSNKEVEIQTANDAQSAPQKFCTDLTKAIESLFKAEQIYKQVHRKKANKHIPIKADISSTETMLPGGKPIKVLAYTGITTSKVNNREYALTPNEPDYIL